MWFGGPVAESYPAQVKAERVVLNAIQDTSTLEGMTWVLKSYGQQGNLQTVLDGTEITIIFDKSEGRVHGSSGCNGYGGEYSINGNKLVIPEVSYAEMGCLEPEGVMEQEAQYLRILPDVESYEISDGKLRIVAGTKALIFTPK